MIGLSLGTFLIAIELTKRWLSDKLIILWELSKLKFRYFGLFYRSNNLVNTIILHLVLFSHICAYVFH